jgi:hypothetical protein
MISAKDVARAAVVAAVVLGWCGTGTAGLRITDFYRKGYYDVQ